MSRRSSRSSRSTGWHSTPKLAQADISLVYADSVQVSTSPGAAAATLPRQSSPFQSNDGISDMNTLENDGIQDDTFSRLVFRSNNSLLPHLYSNKRRQNSAAIPRVERVIQRPHSEAAMSSNPDCSPPSNLNNTESSSIGVPVTNRLPTDSVPLSLNSVSTQTSGLDKRTTSESSLSRSIFNSKMFRKSTETCVSDLTNKPSGSTKPDSPVSLPAESERSSTVNPLNQTEISERTMPADPVVQSDQNLNRSHDDSTHTTEISATSTGNNETRSDSLSYIPGYLFSKQVLPLELERETESKVRTEEIPSHSIPRDVKDPVSQIPEEEIPNSTLPKSFSTWSDYLKFPTSIVPGFRSPSSDVANSPVSSKPHESHSDIEPVSSVPSTGDSWLTPWIRWRSNSPSNSTIEPTSATVSAGIEASQGNVSSIGASPETKAGWLSVLASTSARWRAVKEQGETMEVVIVDEEPLVQTKQVVSNGIDDQFNLQSHMPDQSSESATSQTKRDASATPPAVSATSQQPDFLVLPTFEDTFCHPPRSIPLPKEASTLHRTVNYVAKMLFNEDSKDKGKGKEKDRELFGKELPKAWNVLGEDSVKALSKIKRVAVVGIHGWFPGAFIRQVLGEPTGTSEKFATMLEKAVCEYFDEHGIVLEKVTKIILQGGGTVAQRVDSLFQEYLSHEDWVNDLQTADAILFGTHSQGSIVTTQIVDRLIEKGHIRTPSSSLLASVSAPQHVGILALCGVHNGPFLHLNNSYLMTPYIQYFESAAARELFDFQDSESPVSKTYVAALSKCLHHGVKFTYIASLNDQVVPIYSGAFITATHPLILRALYIDGDAYHSTDVLSNLLILLFKIRNAGLNDSGLVAHLSEATAGSLTGVGHSKAYEAPASYRLAVRFLFETSGVIASDHDLIVEPFTARAARNDYEIPWALRDLIANPDVSALFASEFFSLRTALDEWHPRTAVLRDIRRKLEPIRRLNAARL